MHYTIAQLIEIDRELPNARKLLLVPSISYGRELLASLAVLQGGWIGWEVATLATISAKLSTVELAKNGRRRVSDVAIANAVNLAFERAIAGSEVSVELAALAWSAGTRRAVSDAILELRVAGVSAADLKFIGSLGLAPSLAAIMNHYVALLAAHAMADTAEVFSAAITAIEAEAPFMLDHQVMVTVPDRTVRGLPRQLFEKLVERGLKVLSVGAAATGESGLTPTLVNGHSVAPEKSAPSTRSPAHLLEATAITPTRVMFCAGSVDDELRSVVRQTITLGRSLDEVEIATTDRDSYGATLDALCSHLQISFTSVDGIPLTSTRIGRAIERWLRWVESGLQSDILREALESSDFKLEVDSDSAHLAAELRALKAGWGFDAMHRAITALQSPTRHARIKPNEDETDEAFADRLARRVTAMRELALFLQQLVALAPAIDDAISTADLASRMIRVLDFILPRTAAERATRERLLERLAQVADVADEPVQAAYAIASLRQELSDLRAWTENSCTNKPRRATGGHLHLTSIENAGTTGRPLMFIVGLDADRTAGAVTQSPLLPDVVRKRLNDHGAELPTTEQRRHERAFQLRAAIASPVERLTLSFSLRTSGDEREVGPAPAMLDAARQWTGNAEMSYSELRALLRAPTSPIVSATPIVGTRPIVGNEPRSIVAPGAIVGTPSAVGAIEVPLETPIDARDVWLNAMSDGALLLDASAALRESFPMLNRGLAAREMREQTEAGAFHGLVPAAGVLDPRAHGNPISPSSLERIARCGLNWFYAVALNARVQDEPTYDALVWLNALDRGSALHRIYELLIGARIHEHAASAARNSQVVHVVQAVAREFAAQIPPPSEAIEAREVAALLDEALLFVATEHAAYAKEPWETIALESQFGGRDIPASLVLDDGTSLQLQGRVDRVDKLADGTLRLIDYKTGRAFELDNKRGTFDGGRKLQLALYSPAISAQFDAVVSLAEYRFATAKGDGGIARADEAMMTNAPRIVRSLLDDVASGRFLPTIDASDCKFCDYMSVCRVTTGRFDSHSPRAAWAKVNAESISAYASVIARRGAGDEE